MCAEVWGCCGSLGSTRADLAEVQEGLWRVMGSRTRDFSGGVGGIGIGICSNGGGFSKDENHEAMRSKGVRFMGAEATTGEDKAYQLPWVS